MFRPDAYSEPRIIGLIVEGHGRESESVDNDNAFAFGVLVDQSELNCYFARLGVWILETSLVDMRKLLRSNHKNVSVHLKMHVDLPRVA